MHVRRGVRELHEVAEVLDRAVAPAAVQVAHERRAVVRREDRVHPADLDVARLVARVLGELPRRGRLDDLPAHAARETDALALDVGAGVAEQPKRVGVAAELETDLLEDRVGVVLDQREALLVEHLERGELAGQERDVLGVGRETRGLAGGSAAGSVPWGLVHQRSPCCAAATRRRRRRRGASPAPPAVASATPARRSGNGTTRPRFGKAAVRCGNAIASTKCSWKRGSTAVSIFSTRRTTPSISVRAAPDSSAMSAPGPRGVAGRSDVGEIAVRDEAEDHRVGRVDLAAERPGQPDLVDGIHAELVHQQPDARVERRLGQLDGADVVLGDRDPRPAAGVGRLVEDVAERPAVRDDPRRARGERAVDHAVGGDDAGEEQLGHHLDDPGATDAGDPGPALGRDGLGERRLVGPGVDPDHAEPRFERLAVDPDPLDRAGRGALAAADLGALERRAGRARRGEESAPVAQHDLGVRADVHDQRQAIGLVRLLGEDHAGRVGAHVPGDAWQEVDASAGVRDEPELRGGGLHRAIRRERKRRAPERRRVDAEEQVVHDRVADDRQLQDLDPLDPGAHGERRDQPVQRLADGHGHLAPLPRDASSRTRPGSSGPRRSGSAGS